MAPEHPEKRNEHPEQQQPSGHRRSPSPPSDQPARHLKRKVSLEREQITSETPPQKKSRRSGSLGSPDESEVCEDNQYGQDIRWEDYFTGWPPAAVMQEMSTPEPRGAKRSCTPSQSTSYSQLVRDGDAPAAWTRKHEERMNEVGLVMRAVPSQAGITDSCQKLCDKLLQAEYTVPADQAYGCDRLDKVLRGVQYRNEARVVRDVTPILVPSPELLHIDGHAKLDNICEALNAEWTQCATLCGPRPKPDFVVGLSASAFTSEEKEKLQMSHTSACPNLFPENMYFPFLICEVKGSDRTIEEAERQAMHSASIAIRAVVEIFRKGSATAEVHQKVLAFSVAHNHSMVVIYAHFATITDKKTFFFRRLLHRYYFADDLQLTARTKAYKIIRAIYEHFVPQHLARIQRALSKLQSPSLASFATQLGIDKNSQVSTQVDGRFKKPSLPSMTTLQAENDKLRDTLLEQLREHQAEAMRQKEEHQAEVMRQKEEHQAEVMRQREEQYEAKAMLERQLAQQKEEFREQKAMMERQLAQQKEEFREQKAMMERQLAQQAEIVTLLKNAKAC